VLRLIPCVCMLSPLPRQVRETQSLITNPSTSAFPKLRMGRLLHYSFRGLLSVHSRYGLQTRRVAYATLYTRGLGGFVTSTAAPVATGWSDPVPGRVFLPLWTNAFSRRTEKSPLRARSGSGHNVFGRRGGLILLVVDAFGSFLRFRDSCIAPDCLPLAFRDDYL
jgi:hypothetical protein